MLGVTSINRCEACQAVHGRWAKGVGLNVDDLSPDEAAAHEFGQRVAASGRDEALPPAWLSRRHQRELMAVAIFVQLTNLAGNRFLARRPAATPGLQLADLRTARLLDLGMRAADRLGLRHARRRVAGGASGDILEIGIGTGANLGVYPPGAAIHAVDVSGPALLLAARRARRSHRRLVVHEGDAATLPFPDASFDSVVATFVLCSVGDVAATLHEARRVLRPGGTIRLLEHARARNPAIAGLQDSLAPAWARASGGCRLNHDVVRVVGDAGLEVVEMRSHAGGLLVELVAA